MNVRAEGDRFAAPVKLAVPHAGIAPVDATDPTDAFGTAISESTLRNKAGALTRQRRCSPLPRRRSRREVAVAKTMPLRRRLFVAATGAAEGAAVAWHLRFAGDSRSRGNR